MKLRLFTGLVAALMLGGCATYDYVDRGGGYYVGSSPYSGGYSQQGSYGYGYGAYGYGSSYYGYRPGLSFGLDYGYPYAWSAFPGGGFYRSPYYRPPVRHPVRPDHNGQRPDRPNRPPVTGNRPPQLDGAPWRDLDRVRRLQERSGEPLRPRAQDGEGMQRYDRARYPGVGVGRPAGEPGQARPLRSVDPARQYYGQPRPARAGDGEPVRYRQQAPRADGQRARPQVQQPRERVQPQQRERAQRQVPVDSSRSRSETTDTAQP